MDKLTQANKSVARARWLEKRFDKKARMHANAKSAKAAFYVERHLKAWELTTKRIAIRNALVPDGCQIDISFLHDMPSKFKAT